MRRPPSASFFQLTLSTVLCATLACGPLPLMRAGDLLRGGASAGVTPSGAAPATNSSPASGILPARSAALDRLARTTQALQAARALQDAAHAAALAGAANLGKDPLRPTITLPNVINGLGAGGLQVATGVPANLSHPVAGEDATLWQGAKLPTQTTSGGQTTVTVKQTAQQALLTWQSFNIGKETTLKFDQSSGGDNVSQWIAFNKVVDPSARPSQILGSIQAPGQVYVINTNGIIFGGSSQINVHALVASSLPINDNLVRRGLLNNPDGQFLFTALAQPAGGKGPTPAFTPPALADGLTQPGDVVVQTGARIAAPTSAAHVGGRVALIGPNVSNGGTISTPDGQTILAAGLEVGFTAHDTADATLRGLDVFVGSVGGAGAATNSGVINSPRADVTMIGRSVTQSGIIESSTSVALNGRIDLLANYDAVSTSGLFSNLPTFLPTSTGSVTIGADAVMRILPEWDSDETITGDLALASRIAVQGRVVHLGENATIIAPSAKVSLDAGIWSLTQANVVDGFIQLGSNPRYSFFHPDDGVAAHDSQIYVDQGATLDVSGSSAVEASVAQNFVKVQLRGSELADSPLQRDGALRGQTLTVDIRDTGVYNGKTWIGTPLADVSGYAKLVERDVGQLTTAGGSVSMNAGGSVVLQAGSTVDVSGGWINYTGADVGTTQVIADGHVYDVSQATPDRVYQGIYDGTNARTDTKWGVTSTSTNALASNLHYEAGYIQGAAGGSLAITASSMAVDGNLQGATVAGTHQRTTLPAASSLSLAFRAQDASYVTLPYYAPEATRVIFGPSATAPVTAFAVDAAGNPIGLTEAQRNKLYLSPDLLTTSGFGALSVESHEGGIYVPEGVTLAAPAGGSISLNAANVAIDGSIVAPAGTIKLQADDHSLAAINPFTNGDQTATTPPPDQTRGLVELGAHAKLDVAGQISDNRTADAASATTPELAGGGSVTIQSYSADLADGSAIDVSGGVTIGGNGKPSYGNGGSIRILAGQDPALAAVIGGTLSLGAELSGYSGATGGSLEIQGPQIVVGHAPGRSDALQFGADFFSQGGFNTFTLRGISPFAGDGAVSTPALEIADGTVIAPVPVSWLAVTDATSVKFVPVVHEAGVRSPVNLTFAGLHVQDSTANNRLVARGDVVMAKGAEIRTDPKAAVAFSGDTVWLQGGVYAPGGTISVAGSTDSKSIIEQPDNVSVPLTTVLLGPTSVLSTAGTTLLTPDVRGYRTGSVLAGGTVSVSGNIAASSGALIDVSGATDVLDRAPTYTDPHASALGATGSTAGSLLTPTRIDSDGGTITLAGGEMLFTDATLRGFAGGDSAQSGSLVLSSGRFDIQSAKTVLDPNLVVTQSGLALAGGQPEIAGSVRAADGTVAAGVGHFAVDDFAAGGFGALTLKGTVAFSGPVELRADRSLTVGTSGVITADDRVKLAAPHVALGQAFVAPQSPADPAVVPFTNKGNAYRFDPTHGAGRVSVSAKLIDVGTLSFQNIGQVDLIADDGDIRGDGTLDLAGDLYLRAGQIYPPTGVKFTLSVSDYLSEATGEQEFGSVKIDASGTRSLPLSAGGELDVYASMIHQGGTLRAPFGSIHLGTTGGVSGPVDPITGKAVATTQVLSITDGSVTSVSGVDPLTGQGIVVPYGINLNGTSWIDPGGTDITLGGVANKSVTLAAGEIHADDGSTIDLSGGGDLLAYRWVAGLGGTADVLASPGSYAVIPGYTADYAPYGAYNDKSVFGGDGGYANSTLKVGDRIYLDGTNGLPAGTYTLLPARYALLPGAFLVTPKSGTPAPAAAQPDGSSIVAGYRFNDLDATRSSHPLYSSFEVAPRSVVLTRAQYDSYAGNTYLHDQAVAGGVVPPRLAIDAGQLVIAATGAMTFQGSVAASAPKGGRGGLVDISSPADIVIGTSATTVPEGALFLSSDELNAFAAESLLIGGVRTQTAAGTAIDVTSRHLTLDNAGATLEGADVILAAKDQLTVADGASLAATTAAVSADPLLVGTADAAGSGNGALVRVSADRSAMVVRQGVDTSTTPTLAIGAGAKLSGASLTLDSSAATQLAETADLSGTSVALASGRISFAFDDSLALPSDAGLVLTGAALAHLSAAKSLSFSSYSTIDFHGAGQLGGSSLGLLALHTADVRGFDVGAGAVRLAAQTIYLDNVSAVAAPEAAPSAATGSLSLKSGTLEIGPDAQRIDGFGAVSVNATRGVIAVDDGSLTVDGALALRTPVITGAAATTATIAATGDLALLSGGGTGATALTGGQGANLILAGASVFANTDLALPSGALLLHATTGDVVVGDAAAARLDVSGRAQTFFDVLRYTDGGSIQLQSDVGDVRLGAKAVLDVAAAAGGGDAGKIAIAAGQGTFVSAGTLLGAKGAAGTGGSFALDARLLDAGVLDSLNGALNTGGFTLARSFRVRTGDVAFGGTAQAHDFSLSADAGSITVAGRIDASGTTGGSIALAAHGSVILAKGALLDASAGAFDAAGQGGSVALEAGTATNGTVGDADARVDIRTGSTIDLSVATNIPATTVNATAATAIAFPATTAGNDTIVSTVAGTITLDDGTTVALAANTPTTVAGGKSVRLDADGAVTFAGSAGRGQFAGTLHLRAPQTADGSDVQIAAIDGRIKGASAITVEGYHLFDLTGTDGIISDAVKADVRNNGAAFAGGLDAAGQLQAGHTTEILARLFANQSAAVAATATLTPGAEIINRTGDLIMNESWDLSAYRFGADVDAAVAGSGAPGVLTLRAADNLVLAAKASLSDGFTSADYTATLLGTGARSWSYCLVAGGDLGAADFNRLIPLENQAPHSGSVLFGQGTGELPVNGDTSTQNADVVPDYFQTIRTGTGDITIAAGRDIQFLNPIGAIYTAGTQAAPMADFDVPDLNTAFVTRPTPQYSMAGGNISLVAQNDIAHYVEVDGALKADSSRELPTNWLYRRGYVDAATGRFAATRPGGEIASTTWWTDFTNFYEGVATFGGGDVALVAGRDVHNVDAAVATNARMAKGVPDVGRLVEIGGGDLTVRAGRDIDGGVYYVERGTGRLDAGQDVTTNATRSTLNAAAILGFQLRGLETDPLTWMPTTLFLGKGGFDLRAGRDVLLGPVVNPFWLPQGEENTVFGRTYFTTYAGTDTLNVSSLAGSITLKTDAVGGGGSLLQWYFANDFLSENLGAFAGPQPWLRTVETVSSVFSTSAVLLPASLRVTAFAGDLNLVGRLTLAPAARGTLELLTAVDFNGVQANHPFNTALPPDAANPYVWTSGSINVSDADPARLPGVTAPLTLSVPATDRDGAGWLVTPVDLMDNLDRLFAESGSTQGAHAVVQAKQALHDGGVLHADDPDPVRIYASGGDISGITLYAPKQSRIQAGRDVTDIALYLQNTAAEDISMVIAGRDLVAYDPISLLRLDAQRPGNISASWQVGNAQPASGSPSAGDIQIGGPGTLEVLAGRDLDLGVGPNNNDGTAVGLTGIGNTRNPALPFAGADVIAVAGVRTSSGPASDLPDFTTFITGFLDPSSAGSKADRYLADLGDLIGSPGASRASIWQEFNRRSASEQRRLALQIFYLVLRDAGRDHNLPGSDGYGNYDAGFAAIAALFPGKSWDGDISLTSREIKTTNGGGISILAPGGGLNVGVDISGTQAADQGILTAYGGDISIYTRDSVSVGTSRIFTLRGGDEVIWSSTGDIAAGASSKTVQSAPPTRVLIDPQSADIQTDLAGLATGGGIGVLATVAGVPPGDVDLIAPVGTIDAGDAGIRVSGNINIAAVQVLNAANVQSAGSSAGVPVASTPGVSASIATTAANASAAISSVASDTARQTRATSPSAGEAPSIISVEVLGYGGSDEATPDSADDGMRKKERKHEPENP